jgi:hypothetical protein
MFKHRKHNDVIELVVGQRQGLGYIGADDGPSRFGGCIYLIVQPHSSQKS